MTAPELYHEATRRGLRLESVGDKLAVIPARSCPTDFASLLREHKRELLILLDGPPCPGWQAIPPTGLPLNALQPCPSADEWRSVTNYLLRQGASQPGQLARWLLRREETYYVGPGRSWDCSILSYAAARDCACWQLNRPENEVLEFLEATNEINRNELFKR